MNVLPYEASVESEDGDSVGGTVSAGTEAGSRDDVVVWLMLLDVVTSPRTRAVEGGSPRRRSPPFVMWLLWQ